MQSLQYSCFSLDVLGTLRYDSENVSPHIRRDLGLDAARHLGEYSSLCGTTDGVRLVSGRIH